MLFLHQRLDAQCDFNSIHIATDLYKIGKFEEAKLTIHTCLQQKGFQGNQDINRALRWLSLIAIGEDSLTLAKSYIKTIVSNNPNFTSDPHIVFDRLFNEIKATNQAVQVYSVSKNAEDIETAPAPVILITREEILRRGYVDIIDILQDLPGFEISKIFSATYANVFQLGFRQENTERTLLMIDGVEENDIWSNIAYLSRQYTLSNIKAVEVLYGPSSTMYGPRAFVGAINILTLGEEEKPSTLFDDAKKKAEKWNPVFLHAHLNIASFRTKDVDITMGLTTKNFKLSVTGRYFSSDEDDLSFVEFYNYSPSDIDKLDYKSLNLKNNFTLSNVNGVKKIIPLSEYIDVFNIPKTSPFYQIFYNKNNGVDSIILTKEGIEKARLMDKETYAGNVNGSPNGFSNHTKDYFLHAKLSMNRFVFGLSTWKNEEGFNYYQDIYSPGSRNGNLWIPKNFTFYTKYEQSFNDVSITNLTTFHDHSLDKATNRVNFFPFGLAASGLHLAHLLYPDSLMINNSGTALHKQGFANTYFYYQAKQLRNDCRIFYSGNLFNLTSGIELRSSFMQGDYLTYTHFDYQNKSNQKNISFAQELGTVKNQEKGSNLFSIFDVGLYSQLNISLIPNKLILNTGARLDYNRIRANGGFGYELTPRAVLVYKFPYLTVKAIYSGGLQNVSQWTKFSTGGGRTPNPSLETEKIDFLNLSLSGHFFRNHFGWEIMAYHSFIKDAVASSTDANGITQNRNIGSYQIVGTMTNLRYHSLNGLFKAYLNHTFMLPNQVADGVTKNFNTLRIGDIAAHHLNAGVNVDFFLKKLLTNIDLRANYVGDKKVGPGTTQSGNLGIPGNVVKAYLIFNGALHFSHKNWSRMCISIIGNNLLNNNILDSGDKRYYHPGPRTASGSFANVSGFVPFVPQRPRYLMARVTLNY
jgi:outer membrane receptor for ferrienterochelin and colicin